MKRNLLIILYFSLAIGCAQASYLTYRIAPNYPKYKDETLTLKGLHRGVNVYFDKVGVPHIQAKDLHDLVMATGFIQAKDRFFQMDLMRRIACGRVSELVGDQPFLGGTTVDFDLAMRGWGMEELAERDVKALKPDVRALMAAYVAGVNEAVKRYNPLEYRLLRVKPKPWTIRDSLAVGRLVAWSITHNWTQEADRLLLALYGGLDRANAIYPAEPWPGNTSIKPKGSPRALQPSVVPELAGLFKPHRPRTTTMQDHGFTGFFSGASNAWVVGGGLTASGKPIVAGDPHLAHTVPSMMYQEHLKWDKGDVIGAAVTGIPFVVAGHNPYVAWSITSTVADTVDLCIEKTKEHGTLVLSATGKWVPVRKKRVIIRIRHGKAIKERVATLRYTENGPAFNDMYPGVLPSWAPLVTIRMERAPIGESFLSLAAIGGVKTVQELHRVMAKMAAPVNTWVAGDVQGNIGVFVVGRIPIRKGYRGTFPVPGWLEKYRWQGFIPYAELPAAFSKGKHIFVNANNLTLDPRYMAHTVAVDAAPTYRFDRITDLLMGTDKHTAVTMEDIQRDIYLNRAAQLLPFILRDLKGLDLSPVQQKALNLLKNWNFEARADQGGAAMFFAVYRFAELIGLRDETDKKALDFIIGRRYTTNFIDLAMHDPNNPLWDDRTTTAYQEDRAMVIRRAFLMAVKYLTKALGPDPDKWQWGRLHYIEIHHPFGGKKALARFVNMPKTPLSGGLDSVWKTHFDMGNPDSPFRVTAGPVWRMVVDLSDINHGWWVLDTGESGWPGSPHYKDQFLRWRAGQYEPMLSDWSVVKRQATGRWTLQPGGK